MRSNSYGLAALRTACAVGAALCLSGWAVAGGVQGAKHGGASGLSAADRAFVLEAARGGIAEVEKGKLAASKGANAQVKAFGQQMVDDHSKANDELKQLAASKGIAVPTETDAHNKAMLAKLKKLNGAAFDRAYISDMVKDHTEDVAHFKKEAAQAKDPQVRAWAAQTLPTLEHHLQMAREASKALSSGAHPAHGHGK